MTILQRLYILFCNKCACICPIEALDKYLIWIQKANILFGHFWQKLKLLLWHSVTVTVVISRYLIFARIRDMISERWYHSSLQLTMNKWKPYIDWIYITKHSSSMFCKLLCHLVTINSLTQRDVTKPLIVKVVPFEAGQHWITLSMANRWHN